MDSDTTIIYEPRQEDIEQTIEKMFKDMSQHNQCYVPINKLTADMPYVHQPSKRPPSIDPYSSLEDVGDSQSETLETTEDQNQKTSRNKELTI